MERRACFAHRYRSLTDRSDRGLRAGPSPAGGRRAGRGAQVGPTGSPTQSGCSKDRRNRGQGAVRPRSGPTAALAQDGPRGWLVPGDSPRATPLTLPTPWQMLTWEDVLAACAASEHAWVARTARAWLDQSAELVPQVDGGPVWNDVPDDAAGSELALPARGAWLSTRMHEWCRIDHDLAM